MVDVSREPSHGETDSDSDVESDIADQYYSIEDFADIPPRPDSRLGFNECSLSSTLDWTRKLFKADSNHGSEPKNSSPTPDELSFPDSSSDDESVDCDSDLSDDSDLDIAEVSANFSFNHEHDLPPPSNPRFREISPTSAACTICPDSPQKYSCLPSPFSPHPIPDLKFSPTPVPQRHNYVHRGYSRSGLLHLKWFWAVREEEWTDYGTRLCDSHPYGGINPDEHDPETCPLPPLTIHPRRGDIAALRDPYCAHIDRALVTMPVWTMSKALWMFDVHMAIQSQSRAESVASDEDSDTSDMDMSLLTEFSDDSDLTLVESDCDSESSQSHRLPDTKKPAEDDDFEEIDLEPLSPSSPSSPRKKMQTHSPGWPQASSLPWQTSWYHRLDILFQIASYEKQQNGSTTRTRTPMLN